MAKEVPIPEEEKKKLKEEALKKWFEGSGHDKVEEEDKNASDETAPGKPLSGF